MIPKSCKRLAEVDFPIAEVSKHAAREKSIRHGHPSTLHLWWARRPLASSRAILLALLWPDPCDPDCPADFKEKAREMLPRVQGRVGKSDEDLRKALLKFIGNFANWDFSTNRDYIEISRTLVNVSHNNESPLVVDPFAGGGSIPLEALRVSCDAFASDLNPVAVLINKVLLEDIPRLGPKLADEFRLIGRDVKEKLKLELKEFYSDDSDGGRPIAYLWARTVVCESPNCGAEIPLMRSFWLCNKSNRKRALRFKIQQKNKRKPEIVFEIFEPQSAKNVPNGTVTRAKATCLCCGTVLSPDRVTSQLAQQKGGADVIFDKKGKRIGGAKMLAVVTLYPEEKGRSYRLPTQEDYDKILKSQQFIKQILEDWRIKDNKGICPIPDESLPPPGALGFGVQRYGMTCWSDIFNARQKLALLRLQAIGKNITKIDEILELFAIAVNRMADGNSALSTWLASREEVKHVFSRQALPIVWDYAEVDFLSDATRSWSGAVEWVARVIEKNYRINTGQVHVADATNLPLPDESASIYFTDPPYYDAVPYADLSDYFYIWFKRSLPNHKLIKDPFDHENPLTPKKYEAIQNNRSSSLNGEIKDSKYYELKMTEAFSEGLRILKNDGVASVIFAHKTTEGWEALLSGMIKGGWTITGSWPIATEMGSRLRARESAALATSVHLIARPRSINAEIGDWGRVLRELPNRVGMWMEHLQSEGVRGADLVFACIGPALEIFSRYSKVETAEGEEVKLPVYLEKVWEVVGRIALENILGTDEAKARNGVAGALEEDARLTALFLWTLQSTKIDDKNNGNVGEQQADAEDEDEGQEDCKTNK